MRFALVRFKRNFVFKQGIKEEPFKAMCENQVQTSIIFTQENGVMLEKM